LLPFFHTTDPPGPVPPKIFTLGSQNLSPQHFIPWFFPLSSVSFYFFLTFAQTLSPTLALLVALFFFVFPFLFIAGFHSQWPLFFCPFFLLAPYTEMMIGGLWLTSCSSGLSVGFYLVYSTLGSHPFPPPGRFAFNCVLHLWTRLFLDIFRACYSSAALRLRFESFLDRAFFLVFFAVHPCFSFLPCFHLVFRPPKPLNPTFLPPFFFLYFFVYELFWRTCNATFFPFVISFLVCLSARYDQ